MTYDARHDPNPDSRLLSLLVSSPAFHLLLYSITLHIHNVIRIRSFPQQYVSARTLCPLSKLIAVPFGEMPKPDQNLADGHFAGEHTAEGGVDGKVRRVA